MNIKTVRSINEKLSLNNHQLDEMRKAIKENTAEFKKITQVIEKNKEQKVDDWRELDPYTEESKRPLAEGTPSSIEVDDVSVLMRKLDII